jgi:hypothetical protein
MMRKKGRTVRRMSDTIIMIGEDGEADLYDDTYDITIHCETKEDCDKAMQMLESMRWIPCSERLPEALQEVIVTSTAGYVYTSRIVHGDFEYGGNVIAWMPLPEPYKGNEA